MLGDKINAAEAERMGMIYKVYEDADFPHASRALATTLSQMPTKGLALTKHALNYSAHNSFEVQLLLEDELQQKAARTKDHVEGVKAFLDNSQPVDVGEGMAFLMKDVCI